MIAMSATLLLLLALTGLAFDLGRIYIARNEAQVFTDSAALTAVTKLDGTPSGLDHARDAIAHLPLRWNLGTEPFRGTIVEFSADGVRWEADPKDASGVSMARVTAPANNVDIVFLRAVGGPNALNVAARSVASTNPPRLTE